MFADEIQRSIKTTVVVCDGVETFSEIETTEFDGELREEEEADHE